MTLRGTFACQEIIDRAFAVETLAEAPITRVMFDTGMPLRAPEAGLAEIKLDWPLGLEPSH